MAAVEIVPYDPVWPRRFEAERELLVEVLEPWLEGGIHHVGSTAVPGLAAKPVIDIMAGVRDREQARAAFEPLAALEYQYWPYRPEVMHWFCKPSESFRTHHLHVLEPAHPEWAARLAFRDALRDAPELAGDYERLKRELAVRFGNDREAYTDAKEAFVREAVARYSKNVSASE